MNVFTASPQVYTHRWAEARDLPSFYVPVRISIGCPRYWDGARDLDSIPELMPYDILGHGLTASQFERAYRKRLEGFGAARIQRRFEALFERHTERPLVLVCFEDLTRLGTWCHRSMFRALWQEWTGSVIDEMQHTAPRDDPEPAAFAQEALFV